MPTPALSQSKIVQILNLADEGLNNRQIAKQAGVGVGTVSKVRNEHQKMGGKNLPSEVNVPVDTRGEEGGDTMIVTPDKPLTLDQMYELFKIDRKVWVPVTFTANQWQGFYKSDKVMEKTKNGTRSTAKHQKVALWQTRATWKRIMGESIELALLDFFRANVRPLPKPKLCTPKSSRDKLGEGVMVTWGLWDAHIGMYAWHAEVGASMDLTMAVSRVTNSIDDMAEKLVRWPQRIEKIIMPVGNDLLHYDNTRQKTTNGEHHLDADGRYAKVYAAGLKCLIYMVERALDVTDEIEVVFVPGNHDLHSGYTLCVALAQRFMNDPRVKFNITPNPRKYITFGGTLLGFDHGQKANPRQLSMIFATECAKQWSASTYREVQVGHIHQSRVREYESVIPTNGVKIRVNPALCNVDMYHHEGGLIGEPMKSVEATIYDRVGCQGTLISWARDDHSDKIANTKLCNQ